MNKMYFEDAYVLGAKIKDEVKKDGEKWVSAGSKKMELCLLTDVIDKNIESGKVKYITSVKAPNFDIEKLKESLKRFEKVTVAAYSIEYADRVDYKFFRILTASGEDLTTQCAITSPTDETLPF